MDLSKWMEKNPDKINMVSEGKATVSTELKERVNAKSTPVSLPQTDGRTNWINENRVKPNTSSAEIKENINIQSAKSLRNSLIKQRQEREASFLRAGTLGTEMMKQDETLKNLRSKIATLDVDINTAEKEEKAQNYKQYTIHDGYSSGKNDGSTMGTILAIANRTGQNIGNIGAAYVEKYMTDEERGILKQVLREDGDNAALEYLDFLQEDLNYRKAQSDVAEIEKEPDILKPIITGAYAASSGIDQYLSGTKQLFSEERLPTSSVQYASGMVREGIDSKAGRVAYDIINTTANMAPSILASVVLGGAGAPQVVSGLASSGMIGASAGGNAYNQALEQGYSKEAARTYGTLVGASEAGLQYVLGGISKLGSGAVSNKIAQSVANIDNALLRVAATLGESALSEGTEEGLQEILEPVFKELILDKDGQVQIVPEDVAYSFLLGALSAGLFEGGAVAANAISNKISNTQPLQNDMPNIEATRNEESEGSLYPAQENAAEGQNNANIDPLVEAIIAEQKNNASEGETSDKTLISVMKNAIPQIKNMKAVADVTGNEMPRVGTVVDRITNFISSIGNKVTRQGFGEVLFSRSKIKSSMIGHGIGDAKIETFAAVPAVIQYGEQIDYQKNWKGRNYDTYVFAAPIEYKGQKSYLGVVVIKDSRSNRYYVHEVTDGKGNIIYKNPAPISDGTSALAGDLDTVMGTGFADALRNSRPGVTAQGGVTGTAETSNIDYNIPQSENYVNNDGIGAANAGSVNSNYANLQMQNTQFHPEGANAARPVDVPMTDFDGRNVSKSASTITGAQAIPEDVVPMIEELIAAGKMSYNNKHNAQSIENARNVIADNGFDGAMERFRNAVSSGRASADIVALGQTLLNNAANSRDANAISELCMLYQTLNTNIGQSMQAMSILRKLSPEAQLYGITKTVNSLNNLITKSNKKFSGAEIDKALIDKFLAQTEQTGRDAVLEEIYQNIAEQVPATFTDKWNAWRYMSMLANPRTHIRNIIGNAFFQPARFIKNEIASVLETAYAASGHEIERTKSFTTSPELYRAAWNDFDSVKSLVSGNKYSETAIGKIQDKRKIFNNKVLEFIRTMNSNALSAEDTIFKRITYSDALAGYLKANKVSAERLRSGNVNSELLSRARTYAANEALKATYQDDNAISTKTAQIVKQLGPFGEAIMPFKKTPANILSRSLEYSPLGLIKSLTTDLSKVQRGEISVSQAFDNIAAGATGSAIFALGALLLSKGLLRPKQGNDEKDKWDDLLGHQGYALELPNGTSITLDWLAPAAMPLFMGAEFMSSVSENGFSPEDILSTLYSMSDPLLEMSMLQSLNDMIESVAYAKNSGTLSMIGAAIGSYLSQAIPTIFGQIERTIQDKRMSAYTDKNSTLPSDFQYFLSKASAKVPLWDYNQIPYIDAWGREEATGDPLARVFNNFINPAYISKVDIDKVESELQRLSESTGETSIFPDNAPKYFNINGETKNLTKEEYVKYAKKKGQDSYKIVKEIIESSDYKKLDDEGKADAIGKAYEYANAMAKKTVSDYEVGSTSWINKAEKTIKSKNISIAQYIVDYTLGKQDKKEAEADKYDYDALLAALIAQ